MSGCSEPKAGYVCHVYVMSVPAAAPAASPNSPCCCSAPLWWQLPRFEPPSTPDEDQSPLSPRSFQMIP